jgi:aspartate-semialdehyde dehydrogenase
MQHNMVLTGCNVGIVGATGLVGSMMLAMLAERAFPVRSLRLFASARSAGQHIRFNNSAITVEDAMNADYAGLDIVFFSAGASTSRALADKVAQAGAVVVDNSSAWRSDPAVPLVVAEVNPHALRQRPRGIVANPNCTTMAAMPVLKPLHAVAGLKSLVASTYQAVSGGGVAGVEELRSQIMAAGADCAALAQDGTALDLGQPRKWAVPIGFNVVPFNYVVADDDGNTEEELKLRDESRKILEIPELAVSATCVRVPVFTGHSLAINAAFDRPITAAEALAILATAPGVELMDIPNPLAATGRDPVYVGRVRPDPTRANGLSLFVTGDNLRKGAALNAVQIAEVLIRQSTRS